MKDYKIDTRRIREITTSAYLPVEESLQFKTDGSCIVYWMSREQRIQDNWALLSALHESQKRNVNVIIAFTLVPQFLDATIRQFDFMLKGISEAQQNAHSLGIPFHFFLEKDPAKAITSFANSVNAGAVFTDFDPLNIKLKWKQDAAATLSCPFYEVDAHNIIPARYISQKTEFAAYTLRPKVHRLLHEFMTSFPIITPMESKAILPDVFDVQDVLKKVKVRKDVQPVSTFTPGTSAALHHLDAFIKLKLDHYHDKRNDPNAGYVSDMSPWLHFGNISAQTIALQIQSSKKDKESIDGYIEELIVRKELADNYCLYTSDYDNFNGFHAWAQTSLNAHRSDERAYLYSQQQFEQANTHDPLWNAAQMEMINTGKMHGYMRMYWAKKILEWTHTPEEAQAIAIYLNDTYELDGRDPNGYTGIAWSIGGVHDRAWFERPIFGKIRYMNANGCKSKFDVKKYIAMHSTENKGDSLFP
ncbi:MAG: deoxyribodipyrimidine photo-lyase [Ignavibacteria bacterium]|jgi:deoxyribodipyrimidine photo-lyase